VEGFSDARIPTVALGSRDHHAGEQVAAAPIADDLDLDALLDALHDRDPYETLRVAGGPSEGVVAAEPGRRHRHLHRARARMDGPDDDPTEYLEFERYDGVAEQRLAAIRGDLLDREGVFEVALHHRTGVVDAGEDIVFVVILAGHRAEAFRAVEDGIDRLKDEVPLFKKEVTVADDFWAHEGP